jgi:hypothetical protein
MRGSGLSLVLAVVLVLAGAAFAQSTYRWVDEHGNVHYVGRRDQVPEQYRSQLPPEGPGAPPRPQLPVPRTIGGPITGECILRLRATERRRGLSRSFPNCDACWKAFHALPPDDAPRAECVATSVESYR